MPFLNECACDVHSRYGGPFRNSSQIVVLQCPRHAGDPGMLRAVAAAVSAYLKAQVSA